MAWIAVPTVRPLPMCRGIKRVVAIKFHLSQKSGLPKQTAVTLFYFFKFILIRIVEVIERNFLMPAPKPHIVLLLGERLDFRAAILHSVFQPCLLLLR